MNIPPVYERLVGIFPAIPTALTPSENLDSAAQRRIVESVLAGGVHGIWAMGTGGETAALTEDVWRGTVDATVEAVAGRVPVVVGVGAAGTRLTIERIQRLEGAGVDAVSIIAPYFFFHTQRDLRLHFETILAHTHLPILLYNNPFNTHNTLTLDLVRELSEQERIVGIKDSSGDFRFLLDLLQHCQRPGFRVWTGTEELLAASVLLGAEGAVLAIPVFAPGLTVQIFEAARAGDRARALELQTEFNTLLPLLTNGEPNDDAAFLGAVKMALALRGACEPTLARPLSPVTEAHTQRIRETLTAKGLLPA